MVQTIDEKEKIQLIATWLHNKKGLEIKALDLNGISSVADGAILVSGKNTRHVQALADAVLEGLSENGLEYLGIEGYASGLWVLVDANDILVHIFQEESRSFYNLEGLLSQARPIELNLEDIDD